MSVDIFKCNIFFFIFFFFKQKTAYEMLRSLVGSEMCIRDSDANQQPSLGCHARAHEASHDEGRRKNRQVKDQVLQRHVTFVVAGRGRLGQQRKRGLSLIHI